MNLVLFQGGEVKLAPEFEGQGMMADYGQRACLPDLCREWFSAGTVLDIHRVILLVIIGPPWERAS